LIWRADNFVMLLTRTESPQTNYRLGWIVDGKLSALFSAHEFALNVPTTRAGAGL
jgi:hypothetical protein